MKASIPKAELLGVIETTRGAVNGKSSLPILGALLLEVADGRLTALATDLEMTLEAGCAVDNGEDGTVAVIAESFVPVLKALPTGQIELESGKQGLTVRSGRSKYRVPVVSGEQWPVLPAVLDERVYTVREERLKAALERVLPAAATDSPTAALNGTFWRFGEEGLLLVATDTHRLHVARCDLEAGGGPVDLLLGNRAGRELARLLAGENSAFLSTDGVCLRATCSGGVLTARLTSGKFPAYERYIPAHDTYLKLDKGEFAGALRRAGIVAAGCADRVEIRHDTELSIHSTSEEGMAEECISLVDGNCAPGRFAVSAKNLLAAVQAVEGEVVTLQKGDGMRPVIATGEAAAVYFGVVVPMRLPDDP